MENMAPLPLYVANKVAFKWIGVWKMVYQLTMITIVGTKSTLLNDIARILPMGYYSSYMMWLDGSIG
jgi:hypothetical protein